MKSSYLGEDERRSHATFAALLRGHRLAAGLTQEELAERTSLTREAISLLERGLRRRPHPYTVRTLALALEISPDDRACLQAAIRPAEALRTETHAARSTLPIPPTTLVGREREVGAAIGLVREGAGRLLTLTGPGGVGKTRVALQVATELAALYPDGTAFVGLASLRDPALVSDAIALTLGIPGSGKEASRDVLLQRLRHMHVLLLLDNLEHIVSAAPLVADLLASCPHLTVLATSRVPLQIRSEQLLAIPPLDLPDPQHLAPIDVLAGVPAVTLFLQCARAMLPDFALTPENAGTIAGICTRLDGLPLAIELAAARLSILPPPSLLARLKHRLPLLVGGARDLPTRQQTMRDAIAWSYDLLGPDEHALFRGLCTFAGGFTLAAAEAVCGDDAKDRLPPDALVGVGALVAASLVQLGGRVGSCDADQTPRFTILETIREYGLERLREAGEWDAVRRVHAEYCLRMAEEAEPHLSGPDQTLWLDRLEREHDNLRAALEWACGGGEVELGLRLASALAPFWAARGHLSEGRAWLDRLLTPPSTGERVGSIPVRADALAEAGLLAHDQNDLHHAAALFRESLDLYREARDPVGSATALWLLGNLAHSSGDHEQALALYKESLALQSAAGDDALHRRLHFLLHRETVDAGAQQDGARSALLEDRLAAARETGDVRALAEALHEAGGAAFYRSEYARAQELLGESVALAETLGDSRLVACILRVLGAAAREQTEYGRALAFLEQALSLARSVGDTREVAWVLLSLGDVGRDRGDDECGVAHSTQSLTIFEKLGVPAGVGYALNNLGLAALRRGDGASAISLCERSLDVWRELGAREGRAEALTSLGRIAVDVGDASYAANLYADSLRLSRTNGRLVTVAAGLEGMASALVELKGALQAARLLSTADTLRSAHQLPLPAARRPIYHRVLATGQAAVGMEAWEAAWAAARALTIEDAIAEALSAVPHPRSA